MALDHDALFAFVAFADHLSFTHAAAVLHISQPALHVKVAKLAAALERPLYRRVGRALVLTPEGTQLAAFGREARRRADGIVAAVRGEAAAAPVVLASGPGAFMHLLGDPIRHFLRSAWPLRLVTMAAPQALVALAEARVDVAVVVIDRVPESLRGQVLREVGQQVVVPTAHRLARRRRVHIAELDGERLIVAPAGNPHRALVETALAAAGATAEAAVEATGWEVMLQLASYGAGIAIVNDFCAAPRGLVARPLDGISTVRYWALTTRAPSDGAAALVAALSAAKPRRSRRGSA